VGDISLVPTDNLFTNKLERSVSNYMIRPVCDKEIKEALFQIGDDKALGPDGYTTTFYKKVWAIVGNDVCLAIRDFFVHGKLLQEIKHTIIALLPKVTTPSCITDYRSIACCNVFYKCITKIIADMIKGSLEDIVSIN
jgi:hypothetical protein